MATGASKEKQHRSDQSGGGNVVGKAPNAPMIKPDTLGGKGFTPDNQSTNRPKGHS
jgi:hypothetical protein